MSQTKWPEVELGEVCEINMGQAPKGDTYNQDAIGFPLVAGAGDFGSDFPNVSKYTSACKVKLCQSGDIILGIRASIGKKVRADKTYCLGRGVAGLRNGDELEDRFLWNWLSYVAPLLASKGRGATFLQISRKDISATRVPLPPIEEQRRIAKILDAADALRTKRRASITKLESLTQAIFIDMFGDPVTNPMGWRGDRQLSDVADIKSGITKGRKLRGQLTTSVPYLAVSNVQDSYLNLAIVKEIEATENEKQKYKLIENDLLLTEGGDPDKLGRGCIWKNQIDGCIHQNHVFRVRVSCDEIVPFFLSKLISSPYGKRYFLRSAKQTTGIASINITQLKRFPIIEPSIEFQLQFESTASNIQNKITSQKQQLVQLDTLFSSLQQRAFRGDL